MSQTEPPPAAGAGPKRANQAPLAPLAGPADKYRPLSGRRRLLLLVLAVVTACTVILTMLDPAARAKRLRAEAAAAAQQPQPQPALCTGAQTSGCVGGRVDVIVLPPAPAASGGGAR